MSELGLKGSCSAGRVSGRGHDAAELERVETAAKVGSIWNLARRRMARLIAEGGREGAVDLRRVQLGNRAGVRRDVESSSNDFEVGDDKVTRRRKKAESSLKRQLGERKGGRICRR